MTVFNQKAGPSSCIIQEGEHYYSRDTETVVAGADTTLPANSVLGVITAGGNYAIHDPAAVDGTENAAAVLIYPVTGTADAVVLKRHCQVKSDQLSWITGIQTADRDDALAALSGFGIITR